MKQLFLSILMCLLVPFFVQTHCDASIRYYKGQTVLLNESCKKTSDSLSFKIIDGIEHTYGYDIYKNNQKIIHQPSIPCIKGNKGFAKKEDAEKVAKIVIEKIRKGEMPPTLTIQEMKNLEVAL